MLTVMFFFGLFLVFIFWIIFLMLPGKLFVKVLEAKNLPANQLFGTSDPFPEARLLPGNEKARMHACEDGGKNPHWDWTVVPPWSFLVEDAAVASLEISIFNEKAWISKQVTGNGMVSCHLAWPFSIRVSINLFSSLFFFLF